MIKRIIAVLILSASVIIFLPSRSSAAEVTLLSVPVSAVQTSGEKQYAYFHHGKYPPGYHKRKHKKAHRRRRAVRKHHHHRRHR